MMSLRENIAPALKAVGFNYKYDVSLPIQHMYSLVEKVCHFVICHLSFCHLSFVMLSSVNCHLSFVKLSALFAVLFFVSSFCLTYLSSFIILFLVSLYFCSFILHTSSFRNLLVRTWKFSPFCSYLAQKKIQLERLFLN